MRRVACPCCAQPRTQRAAHPEPHHWCSTCGHLWRVQVPAAGYYQGRTDRNAGALSDRKWADRLADLEQLIRRCRRVVEIGCAEGELGARVKRAAELEYTGVEPSGDAAAASRILDHVVATTDAAAPRGPYDMLLAFHVLEHISNVATELQRWHALIAPAGLAIIEVPSGAGHRLLTWDTNPEHVHMFSDASLLTLCHRSGFETIRLTTNHFESAVYSCSLRVLLRCRRRDADRQADLLTRFRSVLREPFIVYGIGGDFRNYVAPLLTELPVMGLVDSDPALRGSRFQNLTIEQFDPARHGQHPILIASLRYKVEIARHLVGQGVAPTRIVGLDDLYGEVAHSGGAVERCCHVD